RLAAAELLDRRARLALVLLVRQVRARDADEVEALGQRALVGHVVDGGQQLAPREVAGRAEDRHRRGADRQALEARGQRVLLGGGLLDGRHEGCASRARVLVVCPPNRLRSALRTSPVTSPLPRV